jgi:hypothetical protein
MSLSGRTICLSNIMSVKPNPGNSVASGNRDVLWSLNSAIFHFGINFDEFQRSILPTKLMHTN